MNVSINVPRILQAMEAKRLKIVDVCDVCGVNNKTLAKILRGQVPRRIDALYRVVNGLQIPFKEAVIAVTHKATQRPRLYVVPGRRKPSPLSATAVLGGCVLSQAENGPSSTQPSWPGPTYPTSVAVSPGE